MLFFYSLFYVENFIWSTWFLFITKWFSLQITVILLVNLVLELHQFARRFVNKRLMGYSYFKSRASRKYIFWWDMFFSNSLSITFKWYINQFLLLNTFSFLFAQIFVLINLINRQSVCETSMRKEKKRRKTINAIAKRFGFANTKRTSATKKSLKKIKKQPKITILIYPWIWPFVDFDITWQKVWQLNKNINCKHLPQGKQEQELKKNQEKHR